MRILVFGDSIAQGYYDLEMGGWFNLLYLDVLKRKARTTNYATEVFNVSVSGDTIPRISSRLENEIESRKWGDEPFMLVFAVGINDARLKNGNPVSTVEQYRKNLEELIHLASRHTNDIFFVGLTSVNESESAPWKFTTGTDELTWRNDRIATFDAELASFATTQNTQHIPIMQAFMELQQAGQTLHKDGLHPNAAGHVVIYERVKAVLASILNL